MGLALSRKGCAAAVSQFAGFFRLLRVERHCGVEVSKQIERRTAMKTKTNVKAGKGVPGCGLGG
jgi:hypothetical protein